MHSASSRARRGLNSSRMSRSRSFSSFGRTPQERK